MHSVLLPVTQELGSLYMALGELVDVGQDAAWGGLIKAKQEVLGCLWVQGRGPQGYLCPEEVTLGWWTLSPASCWLTSVLGKLSLLYP